MRKRSRKMKKNRTRNSVMRQRSRKTKKNRNRNQKSQMKHNKNKNFGRTANGNVPYCTIKMVNAPCKA